MGVNMIIKSYNRTNEKIIREIRELERICKKYDGIKKDIYLDYSINFNDKMESLFLLYEHKKLISLISMFVPTQREAEISAYTLPEYRQNGYFKELLSKAVAELQKYNVLDFLFVCESQSKNAKKVIEKLGGKYDFTEYLLRYNKLNIDIRNLPINSVELYEANLKDTETLINMSKEIFHDSYEEAESFVSKTFNSDTRRQYIATVNNEPVGMCSVNFEDKESSIFGLGILPEYQGNGYGKQMLNLILRNTAEENIKNIFIEVDSTNEKAFNLYKNNGFEIEVAFEYYRKGTFKTSY
ncbi:MAG: acetyltransferase [Clostridiaceae bacterium]|jgi:ribosomal protein S18 acetylase RimI-like enzyme|nr:acetyltransferase [Clostridiaceae bacterium]